jgi:hypothetical protein
MGKDNCIMSEFYCTQCSRRGIPIWRKGGRGRPAGHLKKLWCLYCGEETNHVECKENTHYTFEDFKIEYEYDNFTKEGTRKQTYGELRRDIDNGTAEKVKTLGSDRDSG